jgi:two-component system, sensor histidine kinase LadS
MALLTRKVLQLRQTLPRLDRVYQIAAWAVLGAGVLAVLTGLDTRLKPWLWWAMLVQLAANGMIAVWLGWRGMRSARLYLLAFGVFILSTLWTLLGVLGLTPNRDWGTNITVLGSMVHMVLMQLTVTERVYAAKRAHDAAREQALLAEQRATARLNQEVGARTAALRRTVDALQLARADLQAALARQTEIALALVQAKQTAEGALADERQLVVMLSHEFRSPLAAIDAATQVLALRQADNPQTAPLLERIRRGIGRARHFLDNCLTDDRLDSASMTRRLQPLDPRQLARQAVEDIEPAATPGRIRLHCAHALPTLSGDPDLLRILLHNLLENALKYAPPETEVRLEVGVRGHNLCLAVQDQGPGIPADEQALVFQKYCRGRLAGAAPGAGLGLSLVARIAQLHRGRVELYSGAGSGTRIEVLLPLPSGAPADAGTKC